jgi:hypothetical protein
MSLVDTCARRLTPLTVALAALVAAPMALAGTSGRVHVTDRVNVDAGDGVELFSNDDFKVTGRCVDNGGGDFTANTFLAAKRNNLLYFGSDNGDFDADFDSSDPKVDFTDQDASGTSEDYAGEDYNQDFYAENRGGRVTQGQVATGVHIKGADCTFSGIFVRFARSGPVRLVRRMRVDAGDGVKLFASKDFKVTGRCVDNGAGDFTANTFLAAKRDDLSYFASDSGDFDTDFDPGDPKVDFSSRDASGASANFSGYDYYQDFYAEGRGGGVLDGRVATGVHIKGADCTFSGIFVGLADSGLVNPVERMKVDVGNGVKLFANKDFKVTGRCVDNGGGDFTAKTFLAAKRDNLLYWDSDVSPRLDSDFDTSDPKVEISPDYDASGTTPLFNAYDYYQEFYAEGRGGNVLNGRVATGVHIKGADCTFSGIFIG